MLMEEKEFNELLELLKNRQFKKLKELLDEMNEVDAAEFLGELEPKDAVKVFRILNKEVAADVFALLDPDLQEKAIASMTDDELSDIIDELFVDEIVDIVEEMPASMVKRILENVDKDRRKKVNQFLNYPEDSAGSIMTAEIIHLKKDMTVKDALSTIRKAKIDNETVYTCYVTDSRRMLIGTVSVKDLLRSRDDESIEELMDTDIISVNTLSDQEEVGQTFAKYGLITVPVTDKEGRLVGAVTVDDAVEVITDEATEDFEKMAAMIPSEKPYLKTSPFELAKNRIAWLMLLMVSGTLSGMILAKFESAFAAVPLLVTFIPMLNDTGGNAGSQTSTMIIRGMALDEIEPKNFLQIWFKEVSTALITGTLLAIANFIRVMIMYPGQGLIALVVSVSMLFVVIIAQTVAVILPIIAKKLGGDPALMAAPFITTIVDCLALTIYFILAKMLLGI